jgi:hypothetical protein
VLKITPPLLPAWLALSGRFDVSGQFHADAMAMDDEQVLFFSEWNVQANEDVAELC